MEMHRKNRKTKAGNNTRKIEIHTTPQLHRQQVTQRKQNADFDLSVLVFVAISSTMAMRRRPAERPRRRRRGEMGCTSRGVWLSGNKAGHPTVGDGVGGPRGHYAKGGQSVSEKETPSGFTPNLGNK